MLRTYLVVSTLPIVLEDGSTAISYAPGASFSARSTNPSVVRLLRQKKIILAQGDPTPGYTVVVGPQGPPGPAAGWTDVGNLIRLITTTDQVSIGGATARSDTKVEIDASAGSYPIGLYLKNGRLWVEDSAQIEGPKAVINSRILAGDSYAALNANYISDAAKTSGLVFNIDPDPTSFSIANIAAGSIDVLSGDPSAVLSAGDFILVRDPANTDNAGIYEVASTSPTSIVIQASPAEDFSNNILVDDPTDQGTVVGVKVAVLRSDASGIFQIASGRTAPLSFSTISTSGGGGSGATDLTRPYTAGVLVGDAVYQKSDGSVGKSSAASVATSETFLGFVLSLDTPIVGQCTVRSLGDLSVFSGLTVGEVYVLATNPGGIVALSDTGNPNYPDTTDGSGHIMREVGTAATASTMFVDATRDFIEF